MSRFRVRWDEAQGLGLPRLIQLDNYSCGYLAVLSVVYCFDEAQAGLLHAAADVLQVVKPDPEEGCDQKKVIRSLRHFGIRAVYQSGLDHDGLLDYVASGLPVIVTVQPKGWECDHWTVVRGLTVDRIFLTNWNGLDADGGMSWCEFEKIWEPHGGGLICRKG